jgi:hypothetical protein
MPGRGTEPGPALYRECGTAAGLRTHKRERTRTCAGCREVGRVTRARLRVDVIISGPRLVPALGTQRRVRALARRSWSQADLAGRLGIPVARFKKVLGQQATRRDLAEKVEALYRELLDREGPSPGARACAERRGWPGPMDWDDPDDPGEVPVCEVERAHCEALRMHQAWRHNLRKREARAAGRVRAASAARVAAVAS